MHTIGKVPLLVLFGLDWTLWPFYTFVHFPDHRAPFRKTEDGHILDRDDKFVVYYPDVPVILERLEKQNIKVGIISRWGNFNISDDLIRTLGWDKYIHYREQYEMDNITTHFENMHKNTGIAYSDMLYFDHAHFNLRWASDAFGVYGMIAQYGMTLKLFEDTMEEFANNRTEMWRNFKEYERTGPKIIKPDWL